MKSVYFTLLPAVILVFCSFVLLKPVHFNTNSWSIGIGNKILLASWLNNNMGDMATIRQKEIGQKDTLYVTQYWCGFNGQNATTTITIKNNFGSVIKEASGKNHYLQISGKLSLTEMLASNKFPPGQILNIYFTVVSKADKINQTVLIGRLLLK